MISEQLRKVRNQIPPDVTLVAVSKTKPVSQIQEAYEAGQRDFGENYVQELVEKYPLLPPDIRWHFIGHLQSNKVKYIVPFVHLVHGVDSLKLLKEINKQALKNNSVIDCLLQVHIAREETKFGLDEGELIALLENEEVSSFQNICIKGLMGMASNTDDTKITGNEFGYLNSLFRKVRSDLQLPDNVKMEILSIGMSSDFGIAIENGSTLVRIGSLIFGEREYPKP